VEAVFNLQQFTEYNIPATVEGGIISKLSQFYNEPSDEFRGVYSRYLPIIENFIKFWDETMVVDEFETDFEVDELSMLFKVWCSSTNIQIVLNDSTIIDLVAYYYRRLKYRTTSLSIKFVVEKRRT
jgi:hypothetical protein